MTVRMYWFEMQTQSANLLGKSDDLGREIHLQSQNVTFAWLMWSDSLNAEYATRYSQLLGLYLQQHNISKNYNLLQYF